MIQPKLFTRDEVEEFLRRYRQFGAMTSIQALERALILERNILKIQEKIGSDSEIQQDLVYFTRRKEDMLNYAIHLEILENAGSCMEGGVFDLMAGVFTKPDERWESVGVVEDDTRLMHPLALANPDPIRDAN